MIDPSNVLKIAEELKVPIIEKEGLDFIVSLLREHKVNSLLEVGTAIGYSSTRFVKELPNLKITTIERNEEWHNIAKEVVAYEKLDEQIELILADALDYETEKMYDCLFIDGAKAQYRNFFEKYLSNLNDGGIIICDNLEFHGLTHKIEQIESKNLRMLVRKINKFKEWLLNNKNYETKYYTIGDGISVTIIKK